MKTLKTAFVLSFIAFMQCSPPDQELVPLSRAEILMQDLKESQVYQDLQMLNFDLDLDLAELGEFPQFDLVAIPIKSRGRVESTGGRKSIATSAILLKFYKNGRWEHFYKIDMTGSFTSADYSDYSGEVVIDAYLEETQNRVTYLNGKFVDYGIQAGASRKQRIFVGQRSEDEPSCQSICHALDCAGLKFEERGWFGKIFCSYNIIVCIGGDLIQCETEGCANSVYKKCGML